MWLMDTMSYELHSLTSALVVFLFLRFHYYNFTSDDMICTVFSSGGFEHEVLRADHLIFRIISYTITEHIRPDFSLQEE